MHLGGKDAFFYKINSCVIHPTQGGKCLVFHCFWVLTLKQSLKNLLCMFLLPAATVCSDCMTTPSMFVEVLMFVVYFQCVHDSTTCHKGGGAFKTGKGQRRKKITWQPCLLSFAIQDILGLW